jgi:hypothetical protein
VRTGLEAYNFFKKGRVFALLWSESEHEIGARLASDDSAIKVYTSIRRFVAVEVNRGRHFVYAWLGLNQSFKDCG